MMVMGLSQTWVTSNIFAYFYGTRIKIAIEEEEILTMSTTQSNPQVRKNQSL